MNFKDSQEDARDLSNAEQRAILIRLLVGCQGFLPGCSGFSVEFQGFSRGCSRSFPCRAEGAIVKRPQEGCQGFLPGCSGFSIAFAKILEKDCSGARRNVSKENDAEHPRDSFFLRGGRMLGILRRHATGIPRKMSTDAGLCSFSAFLFCFVFIGFFPSICIRGLVYK